MIVLIINELEDLVLLVALGERSGERRVKLSLIFIQARVQWLTRSDRSEALAHHDAPGLGYHEVAGGGEGSGCVDAVLVLFRAERGEG